MRYDEILLELYEVGRRIQPAIHGDTNVSLPTQARFDNALDAAQDKLFPESKHKIELKDETGLFFLNGERLYQIGVDKKPWRWVMRRDLREVKSIKHIPLFEGRYSSYPVEVTIYHESINIGCISFNPEATEQIQKWLEEKPKKHGSKHIRRRNS